MPKKSEKLPNSQQIGRGSFMFHYQRKETRNSVQTSIQIPCMAIKPCSKSSNADYTDLHSGKAKEPEISLLVYAEYLTSQGIQKGSQCVLHWLLKSLHLCRQCKIKQCPQENGYSRASHCSNEESLHCSANHYSHYRKWINKQLQHQQRSLARLPTITILVQPSCWTRKTGQ